MRPPRWRTLLLMRWALRKRLNQVEGRVSSGEGCSKRSWQRTRLEKELKEQPLSTPSPLQMRGGEARREAKELREKLSAAQMAFDAS